MAVDGSVSIETAERTELVFWQTGFLRPSAYPVGLCVVRKFGYLEIRVLSSENLSRTLDIIIFATTTRTQRVVNLVRPKSGRLMR